MSWLDLSEDKESTFAPIPAGVYNLIVTDVEDTVTKKMDKRLNVTFTIADGEYQGRKIFEGYQLSGNEKAVQIGRGQLKALWRCAGHDTFSIETPDQFLNIEIAASVKIKTSEEYGDKNTISTFKPKMKTQASGQVPF